MTRVPGIYSDLTYIDASGDLLGMELLIVPTGEGANSGWSVFVQIAEGGAPYLALVPLQRRGDQIEFNLPDGGRYGGEHFQGTLSKTELLVRWTSGHVEHLKRGKTYWR
jgi:hypothetical protein